MKIELTSTDEAPDMAAVIAVMVYARLLHPEPVEKTLEALLGTLSLARVTMIKFTQADAAKALAVISEVAQ